MAKKTKEEQTEEKMTMHNPGWTDYVLGLLEEDERIMGNPTTDGLRRIFESALNCLLVESRSEVVQSPNPSNEKRATVVHSLTYVLKDVPPDSPFNTVTVNGAADVYWGNCDKIFRNHPVAVAETRAEGRALRRALRLKKVLAAEEVVDEVEDIDGDTVSNITNNQINFIDVLAKRLDVNVLELAKYMSIEVEQDNIHKMQHEDAVNLVKQLSAYQLDMSTIPDEIKTYNNKWR